MWRAILLFTITFVSAVSGQAWNVTPIFSDVAPSSSFGSFTSPNQTYHVFTAKKNMTISWTSSLDAISLVLYQRGLGAAGFSISRIDHQAEGTTIWNAITLEEGSDYPYEYVLRAVEMGTRTLGTKDFWSRTFSISRSSSTSTTSTEGPSIGLTIGLAAAFSAGSVAIVVYLIYLLYKRRKSKAKNPKLGPAGSHGPGDDLPELYTYETVPHGSPTNPAEMEVKPAEMEGTKTYAELPAEPRELPDVQGLDELVVERHR